MYSWKMDESTGMVTKTENSTGETWSWQHKARPAKAKCEASNGITVQKIQEAGNKVRVRHLRWAYYMSNADLLKYSRRMLTLIRRKIVVPSSFRRDPLYRLLPKGGYTHVTIKTSAGGYVCLSSECSEEDPFCYVKGVEKALERLSDVEIAYIGL